MIGVITDTHFGARGDNIAFHDYNARSFRYFFDYLDRNNIRTVIHGGDLYDRRKYVNFLTARKCHELFLAELEKREIETHIIAGNHDVFYKNTTEINSLQTLVEGRYKHIHVYTSPHHLQEYDILLVPWICESNQEESLDAIKNSSAEILIGHLELNGFEMNRGQYADHGMESNIFSKYDAVYTGHYHHRSSIGNIHYIGAFTEQTWADYKDPRGFSVYDPKTRSMEFIRNPHSIFTVLTYADQDAAMIQRMDMEDSRNTYVKVKVQSRNNPYNFDLFMEKLYSVAPLDISIVEDTSLILEEDDTIIDESEDTNAILGKYISSLTLPVDNAKMISYMKGIYSEALNSNVGI